MSASLLAPRVPAGVPDGGQFTVTTRRESDISLSEYMSDEDIIALTRAQDARREELLAVGGEPMRLEDGDELTLIRADVREPGPLKRVIVSRDYHGVTTVTAVHPLNFNALRPRGVTPEEWAGRLNHNYRQLSYYLLDQFNGTLDFGDDGSWENASLLMPTGAPQQVSREQAWALAAHDTAADRLTTELAALATAVQGIATAA